MLEIKYSKYLLKYRDIIEKFKNLSPKNQERAILEGVKIIEKYYNIEKEEKIKNLKNK